MVPPTENELRQLTGLDGDLLDGLRQAEGRKPRSSAAVVCARLETSSGAWVILMTSLKMAVR